MKHVTVADRSLLIGDSTADLLVEYATLLAQERSADSIEVAAISADGDEVIATFLLNGGMSMIAETTTSRTPEPDNTRAEAYVHDRIVELRAVHVASAEDVSGQAIWNADREG